VGHKGHRSQGLADREQRAVSISLAVLRKQNMKKKEVKDIDNNCSVLSCNIATSRYTTYKVSIANQHSCECPDFTKIHGKDLCKHIVWTLLYICNIPEDNAMLQQVCLTDEELQQIVANMPNDIPSSLKSNDVQNSPQFIETNHFCPDVRCIKCLPSPNLKSPSVITADSTITNEILDGLNLGQIKVIRDT
jgi:hypothetical protein